MSAYDKVKKAQDLVRQAEDEFLKQDKIYSQAVEAACTALAENRVGDAKKVLDSIGFSSTGESPRAYSALWLSAIKLSDAWQLPDALDLSKWHLAKEYAPIETTAGIERYWHDALMTGSSEIIKDLAPHFEKAGDAWHYNWDAGSLFRHEDEFIGKEDQLIERMKSVQALVDCGCKATRLDPALEKIALYARDQSTLELSEVALKSLSDTYIAVMNRQIEEGRTHFLMPEAAHMAPPESLVEAHALFLEKQEALTDIKPKRSSPRHF